MKDVEKEDPNYAAVQAAGNNTNLDAFFKARRGFFETSDTRGIRGQFAKFKQDIKEPKTPDGSLIRAT
ncbi:MAG: hypothetical protein ACHP6H_07690, partial [Legionellales bacterium]